MKVLKYAATALLIMSSALAHADNIIRIHAPVKHTPKSENPPIPGDDKKWTAGLSDTILPYARTGKYFIHDFRPQLTWAGADTSILKPEVSLESISELPAGISLTPQSMLVAGTPAAAGSFVLNLRPSGDLEAATEKSYSLVVFPPIDIQLGTDEPESTPVYTDFNHDLGEGLAFLNLFPGDEAPSVTWTTSDTLPAGIKLSKAGILSGQAKKPGSQSVTFKVSSEDAEKTRSINLDFFSTNLYTSAISQNFTNHTCAITIYGSAKCWGNNAGDGRLGNGTTQLSHTPKQVIGITSGVMQIGTGNNYGCVLLNTGRVKCWGNNSNGKLGNNSTTTSTIPVDVSNISDIKQLTVGDSHACALSESGNVYCWGNGANGRLGDGFTSANLVPNQVAISNIIQVSAGFDFTCAVSDSHQLYCWGDGATYKLGNGTTTDYSSPVLASMVSDPVHEVMTAENATCIITSSKIAKCWGNNTYGQLGSGDTTVKSIPTEVVGLGPIKMISGINGHHCAVTVSGAAKCWGYGGSGRIGNGSSATNSYKPPMDVIGHQSEVSSISAGENSTCLITEDGVTKCWGDNTAGKLGNGGVANLLIPTDVLLGE